MVSYVSCTIQYNTLYCQKFGPWEAHMLIQIKQCINDITYILKLILSVWAICSCNNPKFFHCHTISKLRRRWRMFSWTTSKTLVYMHVYIRHMYMAVYLRYHVSLLVNINIFYMTPQRATWKNGYYMLNVLPSLNKVLLLLLL